MRTRIYTIGHSRHPEEQFIELLATPRVTKLVDVRRIPFSRRNPQFSRDRLTSALSGHGITYWHLEDLGGLRDPAAIGGSDNAGWRSPFLQSYADYSRTGPFLNALDALCVAAAQETCAIMCAEADWRQCHRQIVSDYLIIRDFEVLHILVDGSLEQARLTPTASVAADGTLLYTGAREQQLPLNLV